MFFVSQRVVLFVHFSLSFFFFFFFFLLLFVLAGAEDKRSPSRGPLFLFFESLSRRPPTDTREINRENQSALNKIHTSLDA